MNIIKNYKTIIIGLVVAIGIVFVGRVMYAMTYLGDRKVTYPWDEYSISEKVAHKMLGYSEHDTTQELKDSGLVYQDSYVISKTKTDVKWFVSEESKAKNEMTKKELERHFAGSDAKYEEEKFQIELEGYQREREQYLNEGSEKLKAIWYEMLELRWKNSPKLVEWEKLQPDSLLK